MPKTQNLRDLLTEVARTRDFEPKMLEQKVFFLWRKLLRGPLTDISEKAVPVSISGGVLKVHTEYPPFKQSLLLEKEKIIAGLNAELGQPILKDIRIDVRQPSDPRPTRAESPKPIPKTSPVSTTHVPTPETLEQIEQIVADVTDTDLKISLRQLFVSQSADKS